LAKNGTLKTYKDLPHGCCQTHPETVNADILEFIREGAPAAEGGTIAAPETAG
jgi:non-heme chloroperoxidase